MNSSDCINRIEMIPRKIHYCWFGGNPLPKAAKKCIESWKKYCPDYEIIRWDESNFDVNGNSFMKAAYETKKWAFVSDYARLKVIYENGGIYLDTDVELLKPLDSLLSNQCYIGIQRGYQCNTGLGFGATKTNPVVQEMLNEYDNLIFDATHLDDIACPLLNDKVIKRHGYVLSDQIVYLDGITVYPLKYFDPVSTGGAYNLIDEESYSIHHYEASWKDNKTKFRRDIRKLVGENNVIKIRQIMKKLGLRKI